MQLPELRGGEEAVSEVGGTWGGGGGGGGGRASSQVADATGEEGSSAPCKA